MSYIDSNTFSLFLFNNLTRIRDVAQFYIFNDYISLLCPIPDFVLSLQQLLCQTMAIGKNLLFLVNFRFAPSFGEP